ncbi:MAG TPA: SMI1/KNR4 family protein [Vicinamibacteria bacterium]
MAGALDMLQRYVEAHPAACGFGAGAAAAEIAAAESALGLPIPEPYRRFLARFDGGFISLCGSTTDADWDPGSAEWNSNALFGTERLVREYLDQQAIWQLDRGWQGRWPYLPFCHTEGQELLVFAPPAAAERAVLDAWHEVGPQEWRVVYRGFDDFLAAYVSGEGRVETIGKLG